jgi:hypothetical protein
MKAIPFIRTTRTIILSLLTVSLGFLASPPPSIADREVFYSNCAELQKVMNDYNPGYKYEGFGKVKMIRRNADYGKYIVFCNGGIVIDREEGTICSGYIAYSFSRVGGAAHYYSRWGRTEGLPNDNDTGRNRYCRRIT